MTSPLRLATFGAGVLLLVSCDSPEGSVGSNTPVDIEQEAAAELVEVPDLVGTFELQAKLVARTAGFDLSVVDRAPSEEDRGSIIEQSPPAGELASPGTSVEVTVSEGPKGEASRAGEESEATDGELSEVTYNKNDPEYKLASVDAGQPLDVGDARIARYATVLNRLESKCDEGRTKLGDMAVVARDLLNEEGIELSLLRVLESVNDSIPRSLGETRCSDIFATLVVLISEQ